MRALILLIAIQLFCNSAFAAPVIVSTAGVSAAASSARNGGNSGADGQVNDLKGERYKIIAVNNYSDVMTAWDKVTGEVFDFNYLLYSKDIRITPCGGPWQPTCDDRAIAVMNDVFPSKD